MKKHVLLVTCYLLLVTFASAQWGWGKNDAVEEVGNGALNYSNGWVRATGIGAISPLAQNPGMARATAVRAAKIDALRNLLEAVMAVTVTSETTIRGSAVENDVIKTDVRGMVQGARIRDINGDGMGDTKDYRYLNDTTIEIEMEVHMSGISSIVLPVTGYYQAPPDLSSEAATVETTPKPGTITGIILDARGLGIRPAMSPRIIDQNGGVVYGSGNFTREYATQYGVAGYSKNMDTAKDDPRVKGNPLVVKGIGVEGSNKTDLVIANSDAFKIKNADRSANFLQNCKVMILLD